MWTKGKVRANWIASGSFFAPSFAGCGVDAKAVAVGTLARLSRLPSDGLATALVSPLLGNSHSVENAGLPAGPDYAPLANRGLSIRHATRRLRFRRDFAQE